MPFKYKLILKFYNYKTYLTSIIKFFFANTVAISQSPQESTHLKHYIIIFCAFALRSQEWFSVISHHYIFPALITDTDQILYCTKSVRNNPLTDKAHYTEGTRLTD